MIIGQVHIDKLLTNFALNYQPSGFIAQDVFTMVSVPNETDMYDTWEQADTFRSQYSRREKGGLASSVRVRVSSDNFRVENYELRANVFWEDMANADPSRRAMYEQGKVSLVLNKLLMDWEDRLAQLVFTAGNVGSDAAVASVWTDSTNSDPVGDINTAIDNVFYATGYRPNTILLGPKVWDALRRHNNVLDKAANPNITGGGLFPTRQMVANIFEVDEILVGMAIQNTAVEDLAQTLFPVWSNHCLVYHKTPIASTISPTFGATFDWANAPVPRLSAVRHAPDTLRKSQDMTVGYYQDEKITAAPLGFILTGATTN